MTSKEIILHRLHHHHIYGTHYTKPEEIVSHLTDIQSQDWSMAKWAIGLRLPGSKEADIELAFNEGKILRTHMLRPTWHFVSPEDIRWIQQLTSARVHAVNAPYYRKFDLDKKIIKKYMDVLIKLLLEETYLTRDEIAIRLAGNRLKTDGPKLAYIMMYAELEAIICSGPRRGKQFTYALMHERAPGAKLKDREESLFALTSGYFTTRGPATIKDFAWWSGLTIRECNEGLSLLGKEFERTQWNNQEYIFIPVDGIKIKKEFTTFLIPDYDEYGISYKDRSVYHHPRWKQSESLVHPDYFHAIAVDGYFGGNWKKTTLKNKPVVEIRPFEALSKTMIKSIDAAVRRYYAFFNQTEG